MKQIDKLIQADDYPKASLHLDDLINNFGNKPDLMLRKAIIEIRRGRLKVELVTPDQNKIGFEQSKKNFLDEVNALLQRTDEQVKFKRISTDKAYFYVQDSPGLNNFEPSPSIEESVPLLPINVRVYQLLPGEINGVKLSAIGFTETKTATKTSGNINTSNVTNSATRTITRQDDRCQIQNDQNEEDKKEKCNLEKPVYIVFEPDKIR